MKLLNRFLALSLISCSIYSCENELDVASPYKEIPVIYGKVSSIDSVHFIRIQKGFISPTVGAYELAKYKDSIYYKADELDVKLINTANNASIALLQVNGNDFNIKKDTGDFFADQNILYKINGKLVEGATYKLQCINKKSNLSFEATTNTIARFSLAKPVATNPVYDFPKNDTVYGDGAISLKVDGANYSTLDRGAIIVNFEMEYEEWDINNPNAKVTKKVIWQAYPYTLLSVGSNKIDLAIKSQGFFQAFSNLEVNSKLERVLNPNIVIKVKIVNDIYSKYIEIVNTQSSSISSDEALNVFSNVKNGKGLFYSDVQREFSNISFSPKVIDYLACDQTTRKFNFLNSLGNKCK